MFSEITVTKYETKHLSAVSECLRVSSVCFGNDGSRAVLLKVKFEDSVFLYFVWIRTWDKESGCRSTLRKCLLSCLHTSEKKTRVGIKGRGITEMVCAGFCLGGGRSFAADGISALIANCCFLVVLSLIDAETSCAVECVVLAALFFSTRLGFFDMSVLF